MRPVPTRRPPLPSIALLSLAFWAAWAMGSGPARGAAAPAAGGFAETIDVAVVNVEVFVADRSGHPVDGLAASDFELLVDGKPVAITNFYAARQEPAPPAPAPPTVAQAPAAGAAAQSAPPAPAAPAAPAVSEDQRLNLAIFVDNLNLTPEARNQTLRSLGKFLRTGLHPGDRVLLASYNGGTVKLRRPPAGDGAAAAAALAEIASGQARGGLASAERRKALQDMGNAARQAQSDAAEGDLEEIGRERESDAHTLLVTLGRFVDSLAGLRGRKSLLYVSGELEVEQGDTFLSDLVRRANAAGVTIYGLGAPEDSAAVASQTTRVDFQGAPDFQRSADHLRTALESVTLPTGGLTGVDLNRPAVLLDRIQGDFGSFYSLGFSPAAAAGDNPKPERLEVRVRGRRGLTVRFPAHFVPRSRDQRLADRTESALLDAGGADNPLGVQVGIERDALAAYGLREMTVLVTVPFAHLTLQPGRGVHQGKVTLFVAARDSQGQSQRMRRIDLPVRVPDAQLAAAKDKSIAYRVKLSLPPGSSTLGLGVRDELGGGESTLSATFTAGAFAGAKGPAAGTPPPGGR